MRLEYKILCVDNDIDSLDTTKSTLEVLNAKVGIVTTYTDLQVVAGAREEQADFRLRISQEFETAYEESGPFDLVLIDLHMQDGGEGEEIENPINGPDFVSMVRDHTMYKPIVFYSGGKNPATDENARKQLHDAIEEAQIWGKNLMVCPRNDLPKFLEDLLQEMHGEEHKINHVRGLLMDQVSEIDAIFIDVLKKLWPKVPKEKRKIIEDKVKDRAKNSVKKTIRACKKVRASGYDNLPEAYVADYRSCDLNSRAMILKTLLEQFDEYQAISENLIDFYDAEKRAPDISLSHIRNLYAHTLAKDLDHNDDRCRYIREESRKHLTNVVGINRENP